MLKREKEAGNTFTEGPRDEEERGGTFKNGATPSGNVRGSIKLAGREQTRRITLNRGGWGERGKEGGRGLGVGSQKGGTL